MCPNCGGLAYRVSRTLSDRVASLFKDVKRYRCPCCDWCEAVTTPHVQNGQDPAAQA